MFKKYLGEIVMGIGIVVLAGILWFQQTPKELQASATRFNTAEVTINSTTTYPFLNTAVSATTNWIYATNSTTSYAFATEGVDSVYLDISTIASSTTQGGILNSTSTLVIQPQVSIDNSHWFDIVATASTTGNAINIVSGKDTKKITYTPGYAATTSISFLVMDNLATKYFRINI